MKKLKKKTIAIFIVALALLYIIIYIVPKVTGVLTPTYIAEYGEMQIADKTTGYIVRKENVYTAPMGGKANRYIEEGTLIRPGTSVMEITGSSDKDAAERYSDILSRLGSSEVISSTVTESSGVVSYYADGYETKLTPETMERCNLEYCNKLESKEAVSLDRSRIAGGEPIFKVVDRSKWYIICFVDEKSLDRYEKGTDVKVQFEDDFVGAYVYKVDKQDGKVRIILETDYYYEKFTQLRWAEVKIITYDEMGLIVENKSIAEKKGKKGVYVRNKSDEYDFTPIKIYASDGDNSLIADDIYYDEKGKAVQTVDIYDEILRNP